MYYVIQGTLGISNFESTKNTNTMKKLERITEDKWLGGVASGLAEFLGWDVTVVRLLFVCAIPLPIPAILPYLILWVIMPTRKTWAVS